MVGAFSSVSGCMSGLLGVGDASLSGMGNLICPSEFHLGGTNSSDGPNGRRNGRVVKRLDYWPHTSSVRVRVPSGTN